MTSQHPPLEGVVGRLAPTPSGRLHLGNARSFLLAWLWARSLGGSVVMRIENIDLPRCKVEYAEAALDELDWLGLTWDDVTLQSDRFELYREALLQLAASGHAYPCTCSRKDIEQASSAPHGDDGAIYPGTCRDRWQSYDHALQETGVTPAWRFRWDAPIEHFQDAVFGDVGIRPDGFGDFVLWRRDNLPSYQLAVVVDDALQGVTQVLRGRDLITSTARQLALYRALGAPAPAQWAHVPLMLDETGRMAKREGSMALFYLRDQGVSAEELVGWLAFTAGLLDAPTPVTATELASSFDINRLNPDDYTVGELPFLA